MFIKLAKSASQLALPICAAMTPFSTAFLLSTDGYAQTTINRYNVPNPYSRPSQAQPPSQVRPLEIRQYSVSPSNTRVYETIPRQAIPPRTIAPGQGPQPALGLAQPTPQLQVPQLQSPANFADVQVVGRGLGTPGLITSGAAERMQQSGLVVEEFRPPQPRVEDFSLDGLPPEARRQFYQQLDLPEGARVMSARIVTADQQELSVQDPVPLVAPAPPVLPSVSSETTLLPAVRDADESQPEPAAASYASSELVQELSNQNIALLKEIQSINERLAKLEQAYHLLEVQMIQVKESLPATIEPVTEVQRTEPDTAPPATEQPATEQPATEQPATEQPATEQPVEDKPAAENDTASGKEKAPGKKKKNKKVAERIEV
ncbi:hypothetical protein SH449x_001035 [Pirellulaceae bacterium SH449]